MKKDCDVQDCNTKVTKIECFYKENGIKLQTVIDEVFLFFCQNEMIWEKDNLKRTNVLEEKQHVGICESSKI